MRRRQSIGGKGTVYVSINIHRVNLWALGMTWRDPKSGEVMDKDMVKDKGMRYDNGVDATSITK